MPRPEQIATEETKENKTKTDPHLRDAIEIPPDDMGDKETRYRELLAMGPALRKQEGLNGDFAQLSEEFKHLGFEKEKNESDEEILSRAKQEQYKNRFHLSHPFFENKEAKEEFLNQQREDHKNKWGSQEISEDSRKKLDEKLESIEAEINQIPILSKEEVEEADDLFDSFLREETIFLQDKEISPEQEDYLLEKLRRMTKISDEQREEMREKLFDILTIKLDTEDEDIEEAELINNTSELRPETQPATVVSELNGKPQETNQSEDEIMDLTDEATLDEGPAIVVPPPIPSAAERNTVVETTTPQKVETEIKVPDNSLEQAYEDFLAFEKMRREEEISKEKFEQRKAGIYQRLINEDERLTKRLKEIDEATEKKAMSFENYTKEFKRLNAERSLNTARLSGKPREITPWKLQYLIKKIQKEEPNPIKRGIFIERLKDLVYVRKNAPQEKIEATVENKKGESQRIDLEPLSAPSPRNEIMKKDQNKDRNQQIAA